MENQPEQAAPDLNTHPQIALINTFCEITGCASQPEALFYLESHIFDLDAAVSTFLDDSTPAAVTVAPAGDRHASPPAQSDDDDDDDSPSYRARSPSPPPAAQPYSLRSGRPRTGGRRKSAGRGRGGGGGGGIRTLSDLNRDPKEDDSDSDPDFDPQEYYTGGEKSGMLVQDPTRKTDVQAIFDQARRSGAAGESAENLLSSGSRNFAGTGRILSGGTSSAPQQPEVLNHNIIFWRNGFTVDDGPLRRLDDPENASFLESVKRGECPEELAPAVRQNAEVHVNLTRREEDYQEPEKPHLPFQGSGRVLGSTAEVTSMELNEAPVTSSSTAPSSTPSLVVDETQPSTSIQLRLADGTRIVSRFNNHHTIRDIRGFIDASRAGAPGSYQLQTMGFPPKQLVDLDQTIDQAGIANSVVIQKL